MNETLVITIIILLCITLAIAAMMYKTKKEARKQLNLLKDKLATAAQQDKLLFDKQETYRNRIVALDSTKKVLVYIQLKDGETSYDIVPLKQVSGCKVMYMGNKIPIADGKGNAKTEQHVTEVILQLYAGSATIAAICFYSEIEDGLMEKLALSVKANEWCEQLNKLL